MPLLVRQTRFVLRARAVLLSAGVAVLGASGAVQAQAPTRVGYAANADGSVAIFSVSPASGALTTLGSIQVPDDARAIVVDSSGRFVYLAHGTENVISAHRIDPAVGLVSLGEVTANDPVALAIEPTGRYLYAADGNQGAILAFRIRADGSLVPAGGAQAGSRPIALTADPSGRFLYGLDADAGRVLAYRIDGGTGGLQQTATPLTGAAAPGALAVEPRGRFLYVLHPGEHVVTVFRLDAASGVPTQIQAHGVKNPLAVAVEHTGRFLYIASPENDALFAYRISQADGRLTHAATELLVQPQPIAVTIDPTNRVVYATSAAAGRVTRLSINPATGVLVEGPSVTAAGRPIALAVAHPTERFLYAAGPPVDGNDRLRALRIDAANGGLTSVGDLVLSESLTELTLEPTGRFVYVLNDTTNTLQTFRIDLSGGQLTMIQTLTVPELGGVADQLTAEPTGRFLYATCGCAATNSRLRAFRINATTGLLTDMGGTGGSGSLSATASATDLSGRFLYMATVNGGGIEAFSINQTTGLLTALGSTPYQSAAGELVMDPLGRFLFVAHQNGFVEAFRVSPTTGALTSAGADILLESGMRGASIDRTGRFFYPVTRGTGGSVHTFAIDPVSGELEPSGVPPVLLGDQDRGESAAVDATGRFLHVGHGGPGAADGIRTFAIEPVSGAVSATSNAALPFGPSGLGTSGRIR
jgi:6-phosphogluconolactonase (cycloisomerase 2 family)